MTEGDSNYENIFDSLVDDIDEDALLRTETLPTDNTEGRVILRTSDTELFYDTGSFFVAINPERQIEEVTGARTDEDETVGAAWSFEQPINANISGNAEWAQNVALVGTAKNITSEFGGIPIDRFCREDGSETIHFEWTFRNKYITDEVDIQGGTLDFPNYG